MCATSTPLPCCKVLHRIPLGCDTSAAMKNEYDRDRYQAEVQTSEDNFHLLALGGGLAFLSVISCFALAAVQPVGASASDIYESPSRQSSVQGVP